MNLSTQTTNSSEIHDHDHDNDHVVQIFRMRLIRAHSLNSVQRLMLRGGTTRPSTHPLPLLHAVAPGSPSSWLPGFPVFCPRCRRQVDDWDEQIPLFTCCAVSRGWAWSPLGGSRHATVAISTSVHLDAYTKSLIRLTSLKPCPNLLSLTPEDLLLTNASRYEAHGIMCEILMGRDRASIFSS